MTLSPRSSIVVAGAGSVGGYVGARLAAAGRDVTFLMRKPLADTIARHGLRVSDLDGRDEILPASSLKLTSDPKTALVSAEIILVTVKAHGTPAMSKLIAEHAPQGAIVVSLQNGVDNATILRNAVGPGRKVVDAMVPFNVVQTRTDGAPPRFHRASSGTMQIERGVDGLRDLLDVPGTPFAEHGDMEALLWGKLLVNLNNALNALSGLPLVEQLGDRRWRLLLSRQIREGLAVLRTAGIRLTPVEGVHPRLTAFALRLPDPLFGLAARRMMAIDRNARSSMWEDLEARRPTEIDHIQGEIVRLAEKHGVATPLNRRVMDLVKQAEKAGKGSPKLAPESLETVR
ncbi:MAG: 2-dehydropantoate 2-reductase [Methyloceanibacter sp.]|uniref:2-dehydropantoate 2-reductase n=1 Tax=Methyloceanibacter sp. TaxID=1965321 RepID=UPI003D6CFE82